VDSVHQSSFRGLIINNTKKTIFITYILFIQFEIEKISIKYVAKGNIYMIFIIQLKKITIFQYLRKKLSALIIKTQNNFH
jgi:hypothetical protein